MIFSGIEMLLPTLKFKIYTKVKLRELGNQEGRSMW
jgi:hypothetical protein